MCGLAATSCSDTVQTPAVTFGEAAPIGSWKTASADHVPSTSLPSAGSLGLPAAGTMSTTGQGSPTQGAVTALPRAAGSASVVAMPAGGSPVTTVAAGGTGGTPAAVGGTSTAAAGSGSAGVGAAGSSAAEPPAVTMLAFDVTTSPVGGRYQPRNIGAIWIENSSGKLVKSLEVWAGIRRRYLTRYASALSGSTVDVTASATLSSHRAHHATWNMKDKSGAAVPAGRYTLVMELTDADTTGRSSTVEFDTSAGAQALMPANAASFSSMQLQLQ